MGFPFVRLATIFKTYQKQKIRLIESLNNCFCFTGYENAITCGLHLTVVLQFAGSVPNPQVTLLCRSKGEHFIVSRFTMWGRK
jgi:hypothetical protein